MHVTFRRRSVSLCDDGAGVNRLHPVAHPNEKKEQGADWNRGKEPGKEREIGSIGIQGGKEAERRHVGAGLKSSNRFAC